MSYKRAASFALLAAIAGWFGLRRRVVTEMIFRSGLLALRSPRFINIATTAAILTYTCRRLGFHGRRVGYLFGLFFSVVWAIYYRYFVREMPRVKYVRTMWNAMIVEKAKLQKAEFCPTIWAFNRHAQTIICLVVSSIEFLWDDEIEFEMEKISSFDAAESENTQTLHWASFKDIRTETNSSPQPIVVIVHGFGDNRYHPYIQRICRSIHNSGWRAAVFSYWRFDFGETRDLEAVLSHVQERNPMAPIIAIAYSAGGHLLLKYLQATGKKTPLVAAISCSGCFDLPYTIENIVENENVSYRLYLNQQAKVCAQRHIAHDEAIDRNALFTVVRENPDCQRLYDKFLYSLPTYSYKDEELHQNFPSYEYRKQTHKQYENQAAKHMEKVQITTLILHAEDDPIVSDGHVNWDEVDANKSIITMKTRRGGHVAWYEGVLPFGETWCDRVCCRFISGVLEAHSQTTFMVDVITRLRALEYPPNGGGGMSENKGKMEKKEEDNEGKAYVKNKGSHPQNTTREISLTACTPLSTRAALSRPYAIARICSASDIQDIKAAIS